MLSLTRVWRRLLVVGVVLSSAGFVSAQQTLLDIDFTSGYTQDADLEGQQDWTKGGANAVTNFVVEGGLLRSWTDTTGGQFIYKEFPLQKGIVTLSWDWQYEGDGTTSSNTGIGLFDLDNMNVDNGNDIDFNEYSCLSRMATGITNNTDTIDARFGDLNGGVDFRANPPVPYKDGKKISVRIVADIPNQKYDVFATREGEAEVQFADDFTFRRRVSAANGGLNAVVIFDDLNNAAGPDITVDNIKVVAQDAATGAYDWAVYE